MEGNVSSLRCIPSFGHSQINNLFHGADDADKSFQTPGGNLSGMCSQGSAAGLCCGASVTPDAGVINEAGESWVWPDDQRWGQQVRDGPPGGRGSRPCRIKPPQLCNLIKSGLGHNKRPVTTISTVKSQFPKWKILWRVEIITEFNNEAASENKPEQMFLITNWADHQTTEVFLVNAEMFVVRRIEQLPSPESRFWLQSVQRSDICWTEETLYAVCVSQPSKWRYSV